MELLSKNIIANIMNVLQGRQKLQTEASDKEGQRYREAQRKRESEREERTESRIAGQKAIIKPGEMFRNMHNIPLTQLTFIQHFIAHIGV